MFERSFDWLKSKLGVSDEQVAAWEQEAQAEAEKAEAIRLADESIVAAQAALEAAHAHRASFDTQG